MDESSTLDRRILVDPIDGRTTRTNITTPTPPNQWVEARQKRSPRGSASTLLRLVDPVVAKPANGLEPRGPETEASPPQST